jgi:hypothetical protein
MQRNKIHQSLRPPHQQLIQQLKRRRQFLLHVIEKWELENWQLQTTQQKILDV